VVSFTPQPLYSPFPIGGWADPRAGLDVVVKEKNFQPLPGIELPSSSPLLSYIVSFLLVNSVRNLNNTTSITRVP
jgi:hypothetical protein